MTFYRRVIRHSLSSIFLDQSRINLYIRSLNVDKVIDDTNLAQCEYCGYVTDWEDVEYVNDHWSDGTLTRCPDCNHGDSFNNYEVKK